MNTENSIFTDEEISLKKENAYFLILGLTRMIISSIILLASLINFFDLYFNKFNYSNSSKILGHLLGSFLIIFILITFLKYNFNQGIKELKRLPTIRNKNKFRIVSIVFLFLLAVIGFYNVIYKLSNSLWSICVLFVLILISIILVFDIYFYFFSRKRN